MTARKHVRYYAKFTVDYADNPKIAALSDAGFRAITELILWSKRNMTDGFVPDMVGKRYGKKVLKELENNDENNPSLLRAENGFFIHDFTEHQTPNSVIAAKQAAGKIGGDTKAANVKKAAKNVAFATFLVPENTEIGVTNPVPELKSATATATQREKIKNNSVISDNRADVDGLCNLLADLIAANGSLRPVITERGWRMPARLLLDKDGRSYPEAEKLVRWCQANDFWRGNVMSMVKFRSQYDHLRLNASRPARVEYGGPRKLTREDENLAVVAQLAAERDARNAEAAF